MNLHAGVRFCVAPRFHSRLAWPERLRLNGGVYGADGRVYPCDDWRVPDAAELALLVDGAAAAAPLPPTHAALVTIPSHVRAAWWAAAESDAAPLPASQPYDDFVAALSEFLRFKGLPLPLRCRFDVVASRPGEPSTGVEPATGGVTGLHLNGTPVPRLVATINLGDEATHVVLLNLPPSAMAAMLNAAGADNADGLATPLCGRFFASLPEYPIVRVRLDPGDGLWWPVGPVVCDGYTREKHEVDIVAMVHAAA